MIKCAESRVQTEINAIDSIVLSTGDGCCTIQLLYQALSPQHFPLQLPANESLSFLDQGYRWDQAADGLSVLNWEYLSVVVHRGHSLWVDHWLTACRWPFRYTYCSQTMMAQGDLSPQVVESHCVIALRSSILGDIVDTEVPVGSRYISCFCRHSSWHICSKR